MLFHEVDYTGLCSLGTVCALPQFTVANPVRAPVFLQYKLRGFYQSSFEYENTLPTLKDSDNVSSTTPPICDGFQTNAQVQKTISVTGATLDPNAPAVPCGFASAAMFNDTFALSVDRIRNYSISIEGIAWGTDLEESFEQVNLESQWIDLRNEAYVNWVRRSPFERFAKTLGRVDQNLQPGNYTLSINASWNSSRYGASTSVALVETRFFGTRNTGLGIALIVVGVLGVIAGVAQGAEGARHRALFTSSFN